MFALPKKLLFGLCLLAFCVPAFAQSGAMYARMPSRRTLQQHGLKVAWWARATVDPRRDELKQLSADEQAVYVHSSDGLVTAFDIDNGKRLWSRVFGRTNQSSLSVVSNDELAFITSTIHLYAVEKRTGKEVWELRIPSTPSAAPAIDERFVYVGGLRGDVLAYNLQKIKSLYQNNRLPEWTEFAKEWRFKAGGEITSQPISTGYTLTFASRDHSVYTVAASDHRLKFQFESDAPISAPVVLSKAQDVTDEENDGGLLYIASESRNGGHFYCVDNGRGNVIWEFVPGNPIRRAPRIIKDRIYISPVLGGMFALGRLKGKELWRQPKAEEFLASTGGKLLVTDRNNDLLILDEEDGAILNRLPMRRFSLRISNQRTDRMIVASPTGLIFCVHAEESEFPIYYENPNEKPILPDFAVVSE